MMRSMMSAVTGLRAQQTAMDVIGNNIANVNTTGFKSSSTNFEDLFYQTLNSGTPQVNPSQVGYGSQVSSVSKNMTSTGATQTDNPTDLYLDGQGFFAVNSKSDGSGQTYYTRVGNFHFDQQGYLVDTSGNYVMSNISNGAGGYDAVHLDSGAAAADSVYLFPNDGSAPIQITSTSNFSELTNISFNSDGSITASIGNATGTIASGNLNTSGTTTGGTPQDPMKVGVATFLNDSGLSEVGSNYYESSQSSGSPTYSTAGGTNKTVVRSNALEMSNVDIAKEFTDMIVTQRGFQANSRVITVSDSMLDELINLKRS